MLLRASLFLLLLQAAAACGHNPAGKLAVDTPLVPYTPPDADELAGLDDEEETEEVETETTEDEGTPPAPDPAPAADVVPASSPPPAPKTLPKK